MAIPGVRMVQSASRPAGTVPDEATLSGLAGIIGRQLDDTFDALDDRLGRLGDLEAVLGSMSTAIGGFPVVFRARADGLSEVGAAAEDIRDRIAGLQTNMTTVSGYLDPLRVFIS